MTPGGMMTPGMTPGMTPERLKLLRWEKEVEDRNRPQTDEELNQVLPDKGYEVIFYFFIFEKVLYKLF